MYGRPAGIMVTGTSGKHLEPHAVCTESVIDYQAMTLKSAVDVRSTRMDA